MVRPSSIAIDGPVAVGKTAVGRLLAQRLGCRFVDTGSMYRALTWLALKRRLSPEDESGLTRLAEQVTITLQDHDGERVQADGCDVTPHLRRGEVEQAVSAVSRIAGVRHALVEEQRALAAQGNIVMVGRDIGTVVLPEADLKLFLEASPKERARRRYEELQAKGQEASYRQVLEELEARDRLDSRRAVAPLRPAQDAHLVDTDGITVDQVVERILALARVASPKPSGTPPRLRGGMMPPPSGGGRE